ncbi:MAG: endo-1,4-beta-xylanase [Spirosoma sp.]|nr:endo-1,4-beta-xylanase [Spirosoma sp.]
MRPYIFILLLIGSHFATAQSARYDSLWANAAVEKRIADGIETNRKGDFTLIITAKNGTPIRNATVEVRLVKHEFLFGSNLFMINGFKTEAQNRRYEDAFLSLFNHGSIPFYWKTLEPEPGNIRFAANSAPVYRRPPPDAVLDFCRTNGIYPKGHTMVWDNPQWAIPTWLPKNESVIQPLIDKRIGQIAERYSRTIPMWDVVNEIKNRHIDVVMPRDFALNAFKRADAVFPKESILLLNETTSLWYDRKREYSQYYQTIENLLLKGARIDAIGLQCHFFHGDQEYQDVLAGKTMRPADLFEILDTYAHFNKPLHLTELTIPTIPDSPEGRHMQATVARNLYRLWFSYPNMASIVWWNIADGTAAPGEDKWRGGFLNEDLTPKPSYTVLNDLINKDWKTTLNTTLNDTNKLTFRGFYGDYKITIKEGKTVTERTVRLTKSGSKTVAVEIE